MFKKMILLFVTVFLLHANEYDEGMKYFIKGKYQKALPYFIKASNNGNKVAQFYLANMYEKGLGTVKDKKMATNLYKLSTSTKEIKTDIQINSIQHKKKSISQKKMKKKIYSKRLKKHFNPEIQAAKEIIFN